MEGRFWIVFWLWGGLFGMLKGFLRWLWLVYFSVSFGYLCFRFFRYWGILDLFILCLVFSFVKVVWSEVGGLFSDLVCLNLFFFFVLFKFYWIILGYWFIGELIIILLSWILGGILLLRLIIRLILMDGKVLVIEVVIVVVEFVLILFLGR